MKLKQLELDWRSRPRQRTKRPKSNVRRVASQSARTARTDSRALATTRTASHAVGTKPANICRNRKVPHSTRPDVQGPIHVVQRIARGLPDLRTPRNLRLFERCIRALLPRQKFAVIQYSIQRDHIHLVVEADNRHELARGVQALAIRIAKHLNRRWNRRGKGAVFAERYFARALKSWKEVWRAVRYVLLNGRKHGTWTKTSAADPFSSGPWYWHWSSAPRRPTRRRPVKQSRYYDYLPNISLDFVPGPRSYEDEPTFEELLRS